MRITYRRWEPADVGGVRRILHDTWMDAYSAFIPAGDLIRYLDEHYDADALREFFEDPNVVGYVAVADNVLAGYARTYFHKDEQRLYVQQLYILPSFQGMGIGKQLMAFAADHAKTFSLDRVWLGVMVQNISALTWYQRMGYQITEKQPFTMGSTAVEHYVGYVPIDNIFALSAEKQ